MCNQHLHPLGIQTIGNLQIQGTFRNVWSDCAGISPLPLTPEVKVIKEAPEWAPVPVLGGARVKGPLDMKQADKELLKWVFGSEYPLHWD